MWKSWIKVFGAREHNLKSIDVSIPKNTLTVITGPSGSGKSSLALDILYAEGKRRYMESLSSYARQFLGITKKPAVDRIDGLCPAIAIEQKSISFNPRSTVGTVTEIYDYLRILFARIGKPHCPQCKSPIKAESPDSVTAAALARFMGKTVTIASPITHQKKGEYVKELSSLFEKGLFRFIINGTTHKFASLDDIKKLKLGKTMRHTIDILIDVMEVSTEESSRLSEAIERAFLHGDNTCKIIIGDTEHTYSHARMCAPCSSSFPECEPRLFSFNSPIGACASCHGLGQQSLLSGYQEALLQEGVSYEQLMRTCASCAGTRLNEYARAVLVGGKTIYELGEYSLKQLANFFDHLALDDIEREITQELLLEIKNRIVFLNNIGLSYLSLNRSSHTISGGEGQRIRLAKQIGSSLSGVLYILDEPSIGLHQRDNDRLIATLKTLRDQGNTVIVVEHDTDTMRAADYVIDMGPAAGIHGGVITSFGSPQQLMKQKNSLSGAYLSGKRSIMLPKTYRKASRFMALSHASKHNLRDITVQFPLGVLCGVSGVSGSGKSTLIMDELVPALLRDMGGYARKSGWSMRDTVKKIISARKQEARIDNAGSIQSLVVIDQSPIGRTPRSNPATYLGIFDDIRALFAQLPESKMRNYAPGRFSFNVAEGRCSHCSGDGTITVEMHFLPPVTVACNLCKGKRYNAETLQILYRGKSIADVLAMTAWEAREWFSAHATLSKKLQLLCDVGLDYIALGQSSTTLSGGEAQRIKLVDELAKRGKDTLYILDEPTTGLHLSDIERLLAVLNRLVEKGNSVIVIEHNLDVLKTMDYLIDLGPEGGEGGGTIVAQGTPQKIASCAVSHTGKYLKQYFTK